MECYSIAVGTIVPPNERKDDSDVGEKRKSY